MFFNLILVYYQYKKFLNRYLIIYYHINQNISITHYLKSFTNKNMWLDNSKKTLINWWCIKINLIFFWEYISILLKILQYVWTADNERNEKEIERKRINFLVWSLNIHRKRNNMNENTFLCFALKTSLFIYLKIRL